MLEHEPYQAVNMSYKLWSAGTVFQPVFINKKYWLCNQTK